MTTPLDWAARRAETRLGLLRIVTYPNNESAYPFASVGKEKAVETVRKRAADKMSDCLRARLVLLPLVLRLD